MENKFSVKQKIQELISQAVEKNEKSKQQLNFLFQKLEEVKELEALEELKGYENNRCLRAYLFYQSIKRANYQPEHLKLTKLDNTQKMIITFEIQDITEVLELLEDQTEADRKFLRTGSNGTLVSGNRIKETNLIGYTIISSGATVKEVD